MLDNTSQLLLRHDVLQNETMLVNALDNLNSHSANGLQLQSHFYYANLHQRYGNDTASFGPVIDKSVPQAVLYVPKEKSLFYMLIDNLAANMAQGCELLLVGSNKSGIKALVNKMPTAWKDIHKVASGNHCLLYRCTRSTASVPAFNLSNYRSQYNLADIPGSEPNLSISNLPGVFSEKTLDAGTRLLLENVPSALAGDVLDFACGSGIIGAFLANNRAVQSLHASDVNAFALQASQWTLTENAGKTPFKVIPSDGLNAIKNHYDWVVTNPPFHSGQKTDYDIAREFIRQVPARLKRNGRLLLVANTFLSYPQILNEVFTHVKERANNGKFRVLEAY